MLYISCSRFEGGGTGQDRLTNCPLENYGSFLFQAGFHKCLKCWKIPPPPPPPPPLLAPTGMVDISWPDLALWPTHIVMYEAVYIMLWFSRSWHEQNWSAFRLKDYTLVFDRNCLKAPKRIWKLLAWKWKCGLKVWKKETIDDRKITSRWQTADAHKDRTDDTHFDKATYIHLLLIMQSI